MPDQQPVRELQLGALTTERLGVPEKSLSEIEQDKMGPRERAQIADIRSVTYIRAFFTLVLLGLLAGSIIR